MSDNRTPAPTIGHQIRRLRKTRGWSLETLARRAGTSAPTLHRYESGWDRFELQTLRRIATALQARVEVRLVPESRDDEADRVDSKRALVRLLAPLFWDYDLRVSSLSEHGRWILERVLTAGNLTQVKAARTFFGDAAIRAAIERRGVDARTRNYWNLILEGRQHASESPPA